MLVQWQYQGGYGHRYVNPLGKRLTALNRQPVPLPTVQHTGLIHQASKVHGDFLALVHNSACQEQQEKLLRRLRNDRDPLRRFGMLFHPTEYKDVKPRHGSGALLIHHPPLQQQTHFLLQAREQAVASRRYDQPTPYREKQYEYNQ